ncbi:MAG: transglycosylase domain-containing protein [Firmicutes bacterium]|nr:transglycosylase domain-containing protein [Bacillota bacterium]
MSRRNRNEQTGGEAKAAAVGVDTEATTSAAVKAGGKTGTKKKKKKKNKKRHPIRNFFLVILCLMLIVFTAGCVVLYKIVSDAPPIDTSKMYELLSETTTIYDDDGNEIDSVYSGSNRENASIADIPKHTQDAIIALEDKTFREHSGFNVIRILGAIYESVFGGGRISGTSTITQQLARNLYLQETRFDYDFKRKIIEAYYTMQMEKELSKDEILEAYLNTIYFGYNSYGIQTAAQSYFSKDVSQLTIAESAALAALPQLPAEYELVRYMEGVPGEEYADVLLKKTDNGFYIMNDESKGRREICLTFMHEQGYITDAEYEEAMATPLSAMLNPSYEVYNSNAAYFADYVISEVIGDLMNDKGMDYDTAWRTVYQGGLKIYSTLDMQAQTVIINEFKDSSNYPGVRANFNGNGDIIGEYGNVVLYDYSRFFHDGRTFAIHTAGVKKLDDGSVWFEDGGFFHIYDTTVGGQTEYSLEFPSFYIYDNGTYYSISGGYINIPAKYKSRDSEGNLIVSADFFKEEGNEEFFIFDENGRLIIPPSSYTLNSRVIQPQAAMTIIENSTGHIKAMVGGRSTTGRMIYNRAISPRQPGSSIKPLGVYSAALQQSAEEYAAGQTHVFTDYKIDKQGKDLYGDYLTAGSIVIDEKTTINGEVWPKNFGGSYSGPQTLHSAMVNSLNTCAVKIWMQVGPDYSLNNVKKFGITTLVDSGDVSDVNAAALALGGMTYGVTSLEMASAYTVFPNNGVRYETSSYVKVLDRHDQVLLEDNPEVYQVLDPGVAWIMANMMYDVIYGYGTAPEAYIPDTWAGGKTGTTQNYYDAWFDGFTGTYTAALWIGNDYGMELTRTSEAAVQLWGIIARQIDGFYGGHQPDRPANVVRYGSEYYIDGTQTGTKNLKDLMVKAVICKETGCLATPSCKDTEEKEFINYGEAAKDVPKYYCYLHNPDVSQYPVEPGKDVPPQYVTVPSLIGYNVDEATSVLAALGLNISVNYVETSDTAPGLIISQTPGSGHEIEQGSTVVVNVATEPPESTVTVPYLIGMGVDEATSTLSSVGLYISVNYVETDSASPGTVIAQNPEGGTEAPVGSTIFVDVATEISGGGEDPGDGGDGGEGGEGSGMPAFTPSRHVNPFLKQKAVRASRLQS